MKVVCAGCGTVETDGPPPVSHGVCSGCFLEAIIEGGLDFPDDDDDTEDRDTGGEG